MNTDHLKIFLDLSKTKNYTKTAQNVYLSQPAVSQAMKTLEKELGVRLLDRNRGGVQLTKCGQIFYNELLPIIEQLDRSVENLKMASERYESSVSVGYSGTVLETKRISSLQAFIQKHPDVTVHMENLDMQYLRQYLLDGQCDMVFQFKNTDISGEAFAFYPLEEGGFSVVVAANHPLAQYEKLGFAELHNQSFIFINSRQCSQEQQTIQEIVKTQCQSKMFYYADSYTLLHELIKTGLGIAILPSFLEEASTDIKLIPLDYDVVTTYGITVLKENKNPNIEYILKEIAGKQ